MKKYKIGIIGYGGFGRFLHHWWEKLDNIEVVAVADPADRLKTDKNCRIYKNWEDLIKDPEIDIVSIVTPPSLHADMACAAMQEGKHVVLEKPAAVTEEQAERILQVQAETGRVITVDHMIRYNPIIRTVIKLGESGVLGKIRHVAVHNYAQDEALPPEHWFWNEKLSGGIMVEHGVHFFDIVNALGGQKFTEVHGVSHKRNKNQRDRVSAMVLYDDGLIADYYHAFSGPGFFEQTTIHLTYDLARIEIEGWMPMKGTVKAVVQAQSSDAFKSLPGWKEISSKAIGSNGDESRPEGWGTAEEKSGQEKGFIKAGGVSYQADQMITGTFEIPLTKGEVYGKCVQEILMDVIHKVEDKNHRLSITVEDGVEALKIALQASK